MKKTILASRYARALSDTLPDDKLDEIRDELRALAQLMSDSREFASMLNNDTLKFKVRKTVLDSVLRKLKPPDVLYNFVHLLLKRGRISLLDAIADCYDAAADRRLGRVRGVLLAPVVVPDVDVRDLQERLSEIVGGKVILKQRQDPSILGGFSVRIGDWLFDATLESELSRVQNMIGSSPGKS